MRVLCSFAAAISLVFVATVGMAQGQTVPGSANPNLAGRSIGYTCCSGDSVPLQAPVLADVEFESCSNLAFSVTGKVSFTSVVTPGNNPDGDDNFGGTNHGDGISFPVTVRSNSLLGVFLTDDSQTGKTTPPRLDFNASINFNILQPKVGQIFFIGDGLTTDSKLGQTNGDSQLFIAPQDATRLFLGTADGTGWFNNAGSFSVTATTSGSPFESKCGDANDPPGITSSDALRVLRVAVGQSTCPLCVCDVDASGLVASTDALLVLRRAVQLSVQFRCDCCPVEP